MKPSSGNHQLGWSRYRGSQDQNPSRTEAGLDASDNIHVPTEGWGRIFSLTSPFIGQLINTTVALASREHRICRTARQPNRELSPAQADGLHLFWRDSRMPGLVKNGKCTKRPVAEREEPRRRHSPSVPKPDLIKFEHFLG